MGLRRVKLFSYRRTDTGLRGVGRSGGWEREGGPGRPSLADSVVGGQASWVGMNGPPMALRAPRDGPAVRGSQRNRNI